jgi:hypothetical protein
MVHFGHHFHASQQHFHDFLWPGRRSDARPLNGTRITPADAHESTRRAGAPDGISSCKAPLGVSLIGKKPGITMGCMLNGFYIHKTHFYRYIFLKNALIKNINRN